MRLERPGPEQLVKVSLSSPSPFDLF
ncbi:MAG: hypothetical protein MGAcid_16800 [uncultured Acidilobus sp. MG]|nr:MAG: hypothetical protein MGAcid_16800 [uncultured Acidilobus sp. MG]